MNAKRERVMASLYIAGRDLSTARRQHRRRRRRRRPRMP